MVNKMSRAELVSYLLGIHGSTFIGLTTRTVPKMRKTGNPYADKVVKLNTVSGLVNFYYDEGVLRRLEKEGKSPEDFKRGESWHEPVLMNGKLTPLCQHKKSRDFYLRMQLQSSGEPKFVGLMDLKEIPLIDLKPFLVESSYSNQGLNDPLKFVTYKLDSIDRMSIKGQDLVLTH